MCIMYWFKPTCPLSASIKSYAVRIPFLLLQLRQEHTWLVKLLSNSKPLGIMCSRSTSTPWRNSFTSTGCPQYMHECSLSSHNFIFIMRLRVGVRPYSFMRSAYILFCLSFWLLRLNVSLRSSLLCFNSLASSTRISSIVPSFSKRAFTILTNCWRIFSTTGWRSSFFLICGSAVSSVRSGLILLEWSKPACSQASLYIMPSIRYGKMRPIALADLFAYPAVRKSRLHSFCMHTSSSMPKCRNAPDSSSTSLIE